MPVSPWSLFETLSVGKQAIVRETFFRCSFSSDTLGPTWDEDEAESTGEIIRLGDTAHTFSIRSHGE